MAEDILTAPIGQQTGDGVFTPAPHFVEKLSEEKDTKEWQNALEVGRLAVQSFHGQQIDDAMLTRRMEAIWVWMNT